jgi:sulfatase modifying factor 1
MKRKGLSLLPLSILTIIFICSCSAPTEDNKCANPAFNPGEGTYQEEQHIEITCATPDVDIRYTMDGSDPTENSELYVGLITIPADTVIVIKARAYKSHWQASDIVSSTYTIITPATADPVFDPPGGSYSSGQHVIISCETEGATIRFSLDGSDPTNSEYIYTVPIILGHNTTIRARAFSSDLSPSHIISSSYYIDPLPPIENLILVPGSTIYPPDGIYTGGLTVSSFYMGEYEVTQASYLSVMNYNPSAGYGVSPGFPVYGVSWFNAIEYCNRRSMAELMTPCYSYGSLGSNPDNWPTGWDSGMSSSALTCDYAANGYRLPRENEWEYAARGGYFTQEHTYAGSDNLNEVAWYVQNNNPYGVKYVGTKTPNEFGIHDLSGNVWEWCWDNIGPDTTDKVGRGGCWSSYPPSCEVSYRRDFSPEDFDNFMGFRICRSFM